MEGGNWNQRKMGLLLLLFLLKYKKYKDIKLLQCSPKYSEAQIDFNKMLFTPF